MPEPEDKEVLSLISAKAPQELKTEFQRTCKAREVNPSSVLRLLVKQWIAGDIELKV